MVLQKVIFQKSAHPELYFRGGRAESGELLLKRGEHSRLDTYFGCFSYPVYARYTTAGEITLTVSLRGKAKVSLCHFDGERETVLSFAESQGGELGLSCNITELSPLGIIYPVIEAESATFVGRVCYETEAEGKDIRAAIAFCTYKREAAIKNNIKILTDKMPRGICEILVIDNGQTLADDISSDKVTLFKNRNAGGSAGFTRGIIEAKRRGFSHVVLMDDDVEVFPESLERMTAILSLLRPEYEGAHISAAMLYETEPYRQHELGARLDKDKITSLKIGLDLRDRASLIENLREEGAQYGAWWCFCLPLSDACEHGLPMPYFIKFDDVEYGLRTCSERAPIITLNGVAVRHEDFDLKYSPHLEYYNIRNNLITCSLHGRASLSSVLSRLLRSVGKSILLYRYDAALIMLRGFSDYLKGEENLEKTDAEALNKELIRSAPKVTKVTKSDISLERRERRGASFFKKIAILLTLGGHLIPSFLLRKELSVTPYRITAVNDVFLRRESLQYKSAQEGYLFRRSCLKFLKCMALSAAVLIKALFCFGKAKRSYLKALPYLSSEEFWNSYLNLQ